MLNGDSKTSVPNRRLNLLSQEKQTGNRATLNNIEPKQNLKPLEKRNETRTSNNNCKK